MCLKNNYKLIKQAFTLIELLVVIAIIGILSGLIIVAMGGITQKANIAKAQVFSNSLRNSLLLNIVAQYTFDDITDYDANTKVLNSTVGNVPDSWLDNEGRAYNGPILKDTSSCVSGNCLSFDGNNDYVDFGSGTNLNFTNTNNFTFSLWAKDLGTTIANGSVAGLLLKTYASGGGYGVDYYPFSNQIRVGIRNTVDNNGNGVVITYSPPDNIAGWHNIVFTYKTEDINGMNLYFDGLLKATNTTVGLHDFTSINNLKSGYGILGGNNIYFKGLIDDIRVYNAAVPTSQIKANYYTGMNNLFTNGSISKKEYISRTKEITNSVAEAD